MMVAAWWPAAASGVLAFLLTYALHSTVLLLLVAAVTRLVAAPAWRDVLWRVALLGGVATAGMRRGCRGCRV